MWTITEVKDYGKRALKANYWYSVLMPFLLAVVSGISGATWVLSAVVKVLLVNPFSVGCCAFFKENAEKGTADPGALEAGFRNYWHVVSVMLLRDVYLLLWSMLFVIPGCIKAYSYRMVPYILLDHPELSANEVITRSREMMDGNKGNAFLLDLSFIGWYLLSILTVGLGLFFWTFPYVNNTEAALYLRLRGGQRYTVTVHYGLRTVRGPMSGQIVRIDLNGVSIGRENDNTICLPPDAKGVSRHHCRIILNGDSVMLADLGSTYGTFLDSGFRLQGNSWYPISLGTRFYLGSPEIQFELTQC